MRRSCRCLTAMPGLSLLAVLILAGAAGAADIHATLTDAQKQFERSQYDQALKLYEQANEAEPGHAAVEYNIALCRLRLGQAEQAIQSFEKVASRTDVNRSLRRDAFYDVGLIRSLAARQQLKELFAPATQPSDKKPAPDDPANMAKLQGIADELLKAIAAFRKAAEVEASEDAEHNIRAARIMRRDVLGLLRKAGEAKQKEDILKDPRAYLEALILAQEQQVGLARLLILEPPKEAAQAREARRAGVRAQRKLMENTGTFADQLSQFREAAAKAAPGAPASAPASQAAEETPKERVYHAAAKQIRKAVELQQEACAFLLDNEIKPAHEKAAAARGQMYAALYIFPLSPEQVLVKLRQEQSNLRQMVDTVKANEDWLRDPLMPEVAIPRDARWDADKTPLHFTQARIGAVLSLLRRQCEHVAAASQPADSPKTAEEQKEPMLDPELNRKLAEVLKSTDDLSSKALGAVVSQDRKVTLSAQDELLKVIDAALAILPKTIEQKITELIVRQAGLNEEVKAEAGKPSGLSGNAAGAVLDDVRKWATRFKSKLLGTKPAKLAEALRTRQQDIREDTSAVNDEVRQKVPAGTDPGAGGGAPAASQPAELKAHIEASKHLVEAGSHMGDCVKGFDKTVVENSLKPMQPDGPVQKAQAKALDELVKALAALKPPTTQPQDDKDQQKQDQQQRPQEQQQDQDKQRDVERQDKEREQAERELYQRRPRTVIKDW